MKSQNNVRHVFHRSAIFIKNKVCIFAHKRMYFTYLHLFPFFVLLVIFCLHFFGLKIITATLSIKQHQVSGGTTKIIHNDEWHVQMFTGHSLFVIVALSLERLLVFRGVVKVIVGLALHMWWAEKAAKINK